MSAPTRPTVCAVVRLFVRNGVAFEVRTETTTGIPYWDGSPRRPIACVIATSKHALAARLMAGEGYTWLTGQSETWAEIGRD